MNPSPFESYGNKNRGTEALDCGMIVIEGPADTTIRPRRPNIPLETPPQTPPPKTPPPKPPPEKP
jgi:hypothetical protein